MIALTGLLVCSATLLIALAATSYAVHWLTETTVTLRDALAPVRNGLVRLEDANVQLDARLRRRAQTVTSDAWLSARPDGGQAT